MTPEQVLDYWIDEVGPDGWYSGSDALDADIRKRFMTDWIAAAEGGRRGWMNDARGSLALVILCDQFPRNMFRGQAQAFATDALARKVACHAVARDFDLAIEGHERHFFYMPFMHAESLPLQERCIRLFTTRMNEAEANLVHARVHREIIRRYGRFPYRNDALDRTSTPGEAAFLSGNGYQSILAELGG